MGICCTYFHIPFLTNQQIYSNINLITKFKKKQYSQEWEDSESKNCEGVFQNLCGLNTGQIGGSVATVRKIRNTQF